MPIFKCTECQGTFRYEEDSPEEWKPMFFIESKKVTCNTCGEVVLQGLYAEPVLSTRRRGRNQSAGYYLVDLRRPT